MPELRQNLATKEWVIVATERALRPEEFKSQLKPRPAGPEHSAACPFCPGNEDRSEAVFSLGEPKRWKVRAVKNKFPAFVEEAPAPKTQAGVYHMLPSEGIHEVIIDSPSHAKHPAHLSTQEMKDLLAVYRARFQECVKREKVSLTLIFKNHGEPAGTSLEHPHSQLVGSSVVPSGIRHRMDEAEKYYQRNARCVFCRMIEEERKQGARILADTEHFTAFVLFAALSPFHIWILPKRHTASFGDIMDQEITDLAGVLQGVLRKVDKGLGDPAYNYVIQSAPLDRGTTEAFHWYLSLVVRLNKTAGFELGSGMFINTSLPEESARFLNSVEA
ncbi:MAG: galactose-1-phosphate uridylyltransferase [Elusimicrobia bacterium]|nr:galactose-1-phosphate uridylyltransferase [Elusimicrobiota bacterium]